MFGETKIVIRWTDVRDLEEVPSLIFPDSVRIYTCDNKKVNFPINLYLPYTNENIRYIVLLRVVFFFNSE